MLIIFFYLILHKPIVEPNIILIFDYRKANDKTIFKRYREVYSNLPYIIVWIRTKKERYCYLSFPPIMGTTHIID
jgi:hypothetical protein